MLPSSSTHTVQDPDVLSWVPLDQGMWGWVWKGECGQQAGLPGKPHSHRVSICCGHLQKDIFRERVVGWYQGLGGVTPPGKCGRFQAVG